MGKKYQTDSKDAEPIWYLAQLRPNHGKIAERNLARQGYTAFLPMDRITKRRGSRFVEVEGPVFPGYIFVALDRPELGLRSVNATYGITKVVSFADKPAVVPSALIEGLQAQYSVDAENTSADEYTPGDEVRVQTGPFADFIATIHRVSQDRRIWVLIDWLQSKVKVEVKSKDVRPLPQTGSDQRAVR